MKRPPKKKQQPHHDEPPPEVKPEKIRLDHRWIIRVSGEDDERGHKIADGAGVTLSEYIRRMVFNGKVPDPGLLKLASEVNHIGINVNQLMPIAHTNGEIPRELLQACRKVEAAMDRLLEVLEGVS